MYAFCVAQASQSRRISSSVNTRSRVVSLAIRELALQAQLGLLDDDDDA
jgi:hypothetical protein